jgi:hypothetical protein
VCTHHHVPHHILNPLQVLGGPWDENPPSGDVVHAAEGSATVFCQPAGTLHRLRSSDGEDFPQPVLQSVHPVGGGWG